MKDMNTNIQEVQRTISRINSMRPVPRNIIIKLSEDKDKERILKAPRKKRLITYQGHSI